MRAVSKAQREKIERALEQHRSFGNAYFMWPPSSASGRRSMERKNNWAVGFKHQGVRYAYFSTVRCSAKNVYYKGYFEVDGERKTVRAFNQLVGE